MRRLLLFILICWPLLFAGSICNVVVGQGASSAPAGDTCGTDDCTFIWYAEHATDVTSGTPAGCSSGDTSPALSSATISTTQYRDGTHSLFVDADQHYAEFDFTSILNPEAGTVELWIYIDTFFAGATIFQWNYGADSSMYVSMQGTADDIEFRQRIYYPSSGGIDANTVGVDGTEDVWIKLVFKWTRSDVNPNFSIYAYDSDEVEMGGGTNNTNYGSWTGSLTNFDIGCKGYLGGNPLVMYIDGVKIWNAWKD